jgi:hypothetical protein
MAVPDTFAELMAAGYIHTGNSRCGGCHARLEWFITPNNRRMPFSAKQTVVVGERSFYVRKSDTKYEPHWASCPMAHRFRRGA